jgi:hypothetical protein
MELPTERKRNTMTVTTNLATLRAMNGNTLSDLAGCFAPDTAESAGAVFLRNLRDAVIDGAERGDTMDRQWIEMVAADAPSPYTHPRWSEFVDLGAYQVDTSEVSGKQVDASALTDHAGLCLTLIAETLLTALVEMVGDGE